MSDTYSDLYSDNIKQIKASAIREICKLIARPEIISLAGGWPDPHTFPVTEANKIINDLLDHNWKYVLQYSTSEGLPEFRFYLSQWVKTHEQIDVSPDNILLTAGSTQGMDLAGKTLLNPDDVVCVGLPTYFVGAFTIYGAREEGIPVDCDGMQIDILAEKLQSLKKQNRLVKLVYIQPNFQNPTGATLTIERRKRLLQLADEFNFLIVEDNPYGDLLYEGERLPSLKSLDQNQRVIYLRSFSKVFSPGIRLAWVAAEKQIIRKMVIAKQFIDACSNNLSQYIMFEYFKRGFLESQIKKNITYYKSKRDFMLTTLDKYVPGEIHWNRPRGGFVSFVTLPHHMDAEEILYKAVEQNVAFVAGRPFFIDNSGQNTMRLSFAQSTEPEIDTAIKILGGLLQTEIDRNK